VTLPETYRSQVQHIQQSLSFKSVQRVVDRLCPLGYTVITPPAEEESQNFALYKNLNACQQQLLTSSGLRSSVPVPPASFHLTLADLIWDSYHYANENSEFEVHLRYAIAQIFQQYQQLMTQTNPIDGKFWD